MSETTPMTLERFAAIVDAYGAEPRAWPEAERDAALAFHESSPQAQGLRRAARALDDLLAGSETPVADRGLEARIMAGFKSSRRPQFNRLIGASAIAASLVIGVTAAWITLRPQHDVDLSDPAAWEVLGDDLEFGARPGR
jgi:hypothetical protein